VSRGGEKLAAALYRFGIDVSGARALDAGASTGGFTDCLLQNGASAVVALDVGRGQLHERLRDDPRVTVMEKTNVRHVSAASLGERFDVVTADLSFISLRTVADSLAELVRPGGDLIVLVKPQFEVGRREAAKGKGVVRDPDLWRRTLLDVIVAFERAGAAMMGVMVSPLRGADGNAEFLAHFGVGRDQGPDDAARAAEIAGSGGAGLDPVATAVAAAVALSEARR
jgi:23S rRNA (cytidine1920-2'-O)/16S rRNA (cytidine1409-2'-O)-methyltransferase